MKSVSDNTILGVLIGAGIVGIFLPQLVVPLLLLVYLLLSRYARRDLDAGAIIWTLCKWSAVLVAFLLVHDSYPLSAYDDYYTPFGVPYGWRIWFAVSAGSIFWLAGGTARKIAKGKRSFGRKTLSCLGMIGLFALFIFVLVIAHESDITGIAILSFFLTLYWLIVSRSRHIIKIIKGFGQEPQQDSLRKAGVELLIAVTMYLFCLGLFLRNGLLMAPSMAWLAGIAIFEWRLALAKPKEQLAETKPQPQTPDEEPTIDDGEPVQEGEKPIVKPIVGAEEADEEPELEIIEEPAEIWPPRRPAPPRQPTVSPIAQLASFLGKNIVVVLLLLGVGMVFAAAIMFMRVHWEQYKLVAFFLFVLLTLGCFSGGYYITWKRKALAKIGFTLLLLGSLLFPLNFYFAVKVGLLEDHGNSYQVLWMTAVLFAAHAWFLRSTIFTAVGTLIISWANWATLNKFVAPHYEWFAIFFAIQALLLLITAYWFGKRQEKISCVVLQYAAHLSHLGAVILGIFFWETGVICLLMAGGLFMGIGQLQYFSRRELSYYSWWLLPLSALLFTATLGEFIGVPLFWRGIPLVLLAFAMAHAHRWYQPHLPKGSDPVTTIGFWTPPVLFVIYIAFGAYTSYSSSWAIFFVATLTTMGYIQLNRRLESTDGSYLAIFASALALLQLTHLISGLDQMATTTLFLLWGLALAIIAFSAKVREREWLYYPLLYVSRVTTPLVLLTLAIWGNEYYTHHFTLLTATLFFAMVFYCICAYKLQRRDMLAAGIIILLSLITIYTRHLDMTLQAICIATALLANVLLVVFHRYRERLEILQASEFLTMPLIITATALSFATGFEYGLWQPRLVMSLGLTFFAIDYYLRRSRPSAWLVLVYFSAEYILWIYPNFDFYTWGNFFMLAAIAAAALSYFLQKRQSPLAAIAISYGYILFALCLVLFAVNFRVYYQYTEIGIVFSQLLLVFAFLRWYVQRSSGWTYGMLLLAYTHYLYILPRDLFPFQYALFFLPVAIVLLVWYRRSQKKDSPITPLFHIAQGTVVFFLALPAVLPGVTPSAFISMCVIALAFAFYFLCVYFYRQALYCYIAGGLFLSCLLAALFAVKVLWGNEIALIMSLGNFLVLAAGYLLYKNHRALSYPLFVISLICNFALIASAAIQGKADNLATLLTILSCSLLSACISLRRVEKLWPNSNSLAYLSVVLFAVSYYMLVERVSLLPDYHGLREYHDLLYVLLAFVCLGFSLIMRKLETFSQAFLYIAILAPVVALTRLNSSMNLMLLTGLSTILYGFTAHRLRDSFITLLCLLSALSCCYAMMSYFDVELGIFMVFSLLSGQILLHAAAYEKKEYAIPALIRAGYLAHIPFFAIFATDPSHNIYLAIIISLINSALLALLYWRTKRHLALASLCFLFAYYVTIQDWATIWELYTIPFGITIIAVGYYLQKTKPEDTIYQDCYLFGLLFIMLPTLAQSYHRWFAHLHDTGVSPYHHLYYSMLLSIESLIVLFYGLRRKSIVFFFTGFGFLLCDILMLLFTYIDFGFLPQSVWWASLGAVLIISAWAIEYRRQKLLELKDRLLNWQRQWRDELRTWE